MRTSETKITKHGLIVPVRPEEQRGVPRVSLSRATAASRIAPEDGDGSMRPMGIAPGDVDGSMRPLELETGEEGDETDGIGDTAKYIAKEFYEEIVDNSNRHEVGIGLFGSCLGLRRSTNIDPDEQKRLEKEAANPYRQVLINICYTFLKCSLA